MPEKIVGRIVAPEDSEMKIGVETVARVAVFVFRQEEENIALAELSAVDGSLDRIEGIVIYTVSVQGKIPVIGVAVASAADV